MSLARERELKIGADWLQMAAFWVDQMSDPVGVWTSGRMAHLNLHLKYLVEQDPTLAIQAEALCSQSACTQDVQIVSFSVAGSSRILEARPGPGPGPASDPYVVLTVRSQPNISSKLPEDANPLRQGIESSFDAFLLIRCVPSTSAPVRLIIEECNQRAAQFFGLSSLDLVGQDLNLLLHGAWGEDIGERYLEIFRSRRVLEEEFSLVGPTSTIWVRQRVVPCEFGVAVSLRDVTRERSLTLQTEEHRRVLENALDGILTADPFGKIDFINSTFAGMLERPACEMIGRPWDSIAQEDERPKLDNLLRQTSSHRRGEIEVRGERPDGIVIFMSLVVLPRFREGQPYGHYVFAIDNTGQRTYATQLEMQMRLVADARDQLAVRSQELEMANVRLRDLATTDGLTGLRNHRYFRERLSAEVARSKRYDLSLSILMVDVDYFKQFNDTYGHPAGDEVLRDLATILRSKVRSTDLVARYGGEEFAVIMPQTDAEAAKLLGERLRTAVSEWRWKWGDARLTISAGGASFVAGVSSAEDLLQRADDALYRAKDLGRNRICFADCLAEESTEGS